MKSSLIIFPLAFLNGVTLLASVLKVTDFGAAGDAVQLVVNTTSNSPMVSVIGTNRFTSTDIGKVIEVFRAGPWLYYSNNPACGVAVTNQDTICLITNVSDGTNLWGTIPQGWTTNAYCVIGTNNASAFQAAIDTAEFNVSATNPNVTIYIPSGTYLLIGNKALNPSYIKNNIADSDASLKITSGGITFLGESPTNTILMGCGAGMEHVLWNNGNPADPNPYGRSGCFAPIRGTIFYCYGPITNSQYPLVFQNLTFDGGLTNGLQSYNYWILYLGNGDGWDTTHDALLDVNPDPTHPQMHQMKVFTNCVFRHWRGEILKCVTGPGGTNTFNDIANCIFFDGNASANNLYYGQHVHGCAFSKLVKVEEYYQANTTLPSVFENNLWTNIVSNPFSIVGSRTNAIPPPFTIRNNVMAGVGNMDQISFAPAENVNIISNEFYGPSTGVAFITAGEQPSDGTASGINNILISGNSFNDTYLPIYILFYGVNNVLITNNTTSNGGQQFFLAYAGWITNIVIAGNHSPDPGIGAGGIAGGSYPLDINNSFGVGQGDNDTTGHTNAISYGDGSFHQITYEVPNSVFYLDDSRPSLVPAGAVLKIKNSGPISATIYRSKKSLTTNAINPIDSLSTGASKNYIWNTTYDIWQPESTLPNAPVLIY
jgi:hypothetical protein